jgi:S1-C subfamily serine protease
MLKRWNHATRVGLFSVARRAMKSSATSSLALALLLATNQAPTSGDPMDEDTLTFARKAAVMVRTSSSKSREGDTLFGTGSGFFVNSTGLCISNNHVVDPGHQKPEAEKFRLKNSLNRLVWTIVTGSGTEDEQEWKADVLYQNERADIAVMQVKDEDGEFLSTPDYLRFVPTSEIKEKMTAWCLGFPGGDRRKNDQEFPPIAVTSGNIVALPRTASGRITMIETDVLANQGNSGGPFVSTDGRLIGVLTLGSQTEGRTNTTMLVPGDLVQEMILTAFRREKISRTVDLRPFYDLFTLKDGTWSLPQYERSELLDCITLENGSRICGKVSDNQAWSSVVGDISIPSDKMAYVVSDDFDNAMVFVEGGDRFTVERTSTSIKFSPEGGSVVEVPLSDIAWIGYRLPPSPPPVPEGQVYTIGSDTFRLSILDLSGNVKFKESTLGATMTVPAKDIRKIETIDGDQVIYTASGSRMTGQFLTHKIEGELAWSGTPIQLTYEDIESATVRFVNYSEAARPSEINLVKSLDTTDPRLIRIAKNLDSNDVDSTGPLLTTLFSDATFKTLSSEKQEQARFLRGEYLLRTGKHDESIEMFRRLRRARKEPVMWHARARLKMLETYSDEQFGDKSISDPEVFSRAAHALAASMQNEAVMALDGIERGDPQGRGDYNRLIKRAKDTEETLQITNRLTGGASDEYLVRLWRVTGTLHGGEIRRLQEQQRELEESLSRPGAGGRPLSDYQRRQIQKKIDGIDRHIERAQEAIQEVQRKIQAAGFIIDDPDLERS